MIGSKPFIFFLTDTPTGLCWYVDSNGNVKKGNPRSGIDVSLPNAPSNWQDISLGFDRNTTYHGINRTYAEPLKMVKDVAKICRTLFYNQTGTESQLTLVVYKYNDKPQLNDPTYKLYTKGQLDMAKFTDSPDQGFQVNLMEGGITQLLKTYENTVFELPLDGSIKENIKLKMDGMLLPDTFNYQVSYNQADTTQRSYTLPCVYISNDGDNFGIIHNDPSMDGLGNPFAKNPDFIFQSTRPITVRVKGNVIARPYQNGVVDYISVYCKTSKSTFDLPQVGDIPLVANNTPISSFQNLPFDRYITLAANEALFICVAHTNMNHAFAIESGSFQISFASMAATTTPWCMTAYDVGRLLVNQMNLAASTTNQTFDFGFDSQLLLNNLNLIYTSGDGLRSSGDANYSQYYRQYTTQNTTQLTTVYGVVLKISWSEFCDDVKKRLMAACGSQQLAGKKQSVYIEALEYAYDPKGQQMDVGEVSNIKISLDNEVMFSHIKVGTVKQSYDQQAGKNEFNTTNEFIAPVKALTNTLDLTKRIRDDAYGGERLRANVDGTSTTRNDSDNDIFAFDCDETTATRDFQRVSFTSQYQTFTDDNNTNIRITENSPVNPINMTDIEGNYLSINTDPSIFVIGNNGGNHTLVFAYTGHLLGNPYNAITNNPADTVSINLYINGVLVFTDTVTVGNTVSTPVNGNFSVTQVFNRGDVIYVTATTSINGSCTLDNISLTMDNGAYWAAIGVNILIDTGTPIKYLAMPSVTDFDSDKKSVHYSFQYFLFDSLLVNNDFDVQVNMDVLQTADNAGDLSTFYLYRNGQIIYTTSVHGTQPNMLQIAMQVVGLTLSIGDIFYILADATFTDTQITQAEIIFTSRSIMAYSLYRESYDSISGIPILSTDPVTGLPSTTVAGAPYNLRFSPKRQMDTWARYIKSGLFNISGNIQFATSAKNQYLSTTKNGVTITENADVPTASLGLPLWWPLIVEFDCKVPMTFADIMTSSANAHINALYNGTYIGGFPLGMTQKAALNEMQTFRIRLSTRTSLSDLLDLNIDGINLNIMPPLSMYVAKTCPLQFVPLGLTLDPRYHRANMDEYWLETQIQNWASSRKYYQKWQLNDNPIPLQVATNGISPLTVQVYQVSGWDNKTTLVRSAVVNNPTVSAAVINPLFLWQYNIGLSTLTEGTYHVVLTAGSGPNSISMISEGLHLKADWPFTLLFEASNSKNVYNTFFDTGYSTAIRIEGMIGQMMMESKMSQYIDQPEDISVISAFPYSTFNLLLGRNEGIPDWMADKARMIMLLDSVYIENKQYSLDDGAKWEPTTHNGVITQYWKTVIRPSQANTFIGVGLNGTITTNSSMIATLDAKDLGPNANNLSSNTNSDIISIEITN